MVSTGICTYLQRTTGRLRCAQLPPLVGPAVTGLLPAGQRDPLTTASRFYVQLLFILPPPRTRACVAYGGGNPPTAGFFAFRRSMSGPTFFQSIVYVAYKLTNTQMVKHYFIGPTFMRWSDS